MSEPTALSLAASCASYAAAVAMVRRIVRRLPRWRRSRLRYNVVSYAAFQLRGDLWVATIDGVDHLTSSRDAMQEFLDRLDDPPAPRRTRWPGRRAAQSLVLLACVITQQASIPSRDSCAAGMFGCNWSECNDSQRAAVVRCLGWALP